MATSTTDHPLLTVPKLAQAPTIDGQLTEAEWEKAAATTGFVASMTRPWLRTRVSSIRVGTIRRIYVAFVCLDPHAASPVARLKDRDGAVFVEDAVDFICRPRPRASAVLPLHLQCHRHGLRLPHGLRRAVTAADLSFNPNCTFKTTQRPTGG